MPLTKTGTKVKAAFAKTYGAKKGKSVFYATLNKNKKLRAKAEPKRAR